MYICLKKMAYQLVLSSTDLAIVSDKKRKEKDVKLLRRYQCLSMLHENYPKKEISKILGIHVDTVTDWAKIYLTEGLSKLVVFNYEGRRPSCLDKIQDKIIGYVKSDCISTIAHLQFTLKEKHQLEIEQSWLFRYCKKNSISLIKKHD